MINKYVYHKMLFYFYLIFLIFWLKIWWPTNHFLIELYLISMLLSLLFLNLNLFLIFHFLKIIIYFISQNLSIYHSLIQFMKLLLPIILIIILICLIHQHFYQIIILIKQIVLPLFSMYFIKLPINLLISTILNLFYLYLC